MRIQNRERLLRLRLVDVRAVDAVDVTERLCAELDAALQPAGIQVEASKRSPHVIEHATDNLSLPDLAQLQALVATAEARDPEAEATLVIVRDGPRADGLRGSLLSVPGAERRAAVVFAGDGDVSKLAVSFLRTCMHELGHLLNLVHPFEIEINQPELASCMNYTHIYALLTSQPPASLPAAYSDFELRHHLTHGRDAAVCPGGTPFHSAPYWERDSTPLLVPTQPDTSVSFQLTLEPPEQDDFIVGQPVFLGVRLKAPEPATGPAWLLDPKAGQLEVQIRGPRRGAASLDRKNPRRFLPIAARCFEADLKQPVPTKINLNLAYDSDGFAFPEAGTYEVRVVLRLLGVEALPYHPAASLKNTVIVSDWLRLDVGEAEGLEERDRALLRDPRTGLYWALGGAATLGDVAARLDDYVARQYTGGREVRDPIVAHALRCRGLEAARRYLRPERAASSGEALRYLRAIQDAPCFDRVTRDEMQQLVQRLSESPEQPLEREATHREPAGLPVDHDGRAEVAAGPAANPPSNSNTPREGWNLLVFMAAESSNLSTPAEADLRELQAAAPEREDDRVRVFVQIDTGGPTGTRRYQIVRGGPIELAPPAETNTGDPATLRAFALWAQREQRARRTLLVLWGHSQGVGFGVEPGLRFFAPPESADFGFDVTSDDALTLPELGRALRAGPPDPRRALLRLLAETRRIREILEPPDSVQAPELEQPIDILGFDSCFMAGVEVAAQLGSSVRYLLAGPAAVPLTGWDYRDVLRELTRRPGIPPEALGRRLSALSVTWPERPELTLINLSRRRELLTRVRALVRAIESAARDEGERRRLLAAFQAAPSIGAREFLDLRELGRVIEQGARDTQVQWAAARVARFLSPGPGRFVEAVAPAREGRKPGGGVSVYTPLVSGAGPRALVDQALYARLRFCRRTGWADLVQSETLLRATLPELVSKVARSAGAETGNGATDTRARVITLLTELGVDPATATLVASRANTGELLDRSLDPKPSPPDRSNDPKPGDPSKGIGAPN